jgi:TldD protein
LAVADSSTRVILRIVAASIRVGLLVLLSGAALAQAPSLLDVLSAELDRNYSILKEKGDPPPYFASYAVTESESFSIAGTSGAILASERGHDRHLDVSIRVGSPRFDNYHRVQGERPRFTSGAAIPIDDAPDAIRHWVWLETDRVYRAASERLIKIRSAAQVKLSEDSSADFSQETPVQFAQSPGKWKFPVDDWTNHLRKWSSGFAGHPLVLNSGVSVSAQREVKYLVNTEGTRLMHGRAFVQLSVAGHGKAADGMDLTAHETVDVEDASKLPKDGVVHAAVERVAATIERLRKAPLVDPYAGPAILSGRAAGVFFHEIFGHRVEGHRQKDPGEGQTFAKNVGKPVLPDFLSVVFDPTLHHAGSSELNGWYLYDDEGVAARRTPLVENGILKTFLMSRSPIPGFAQSNGHGRRQPGAEVVSRQSNLLVESSKRVSDPRLREMLIEEIRRQNKPYGLYFEQVVGGYTSTAARGLQAFTVIPLVVYRVYPDGRGDELVRGADIVGTPLASFSKIVATSDRSEVFNGICGAESGGVPVSAVSPALLVSEIEVQKKENSQERPPLLEAPGESK